MRIVLLAVLLLGLSQRPPLEARFIGNMAFAITDGTTTLMTDFPYQSGYSVYMRYPASEIRSSTPRTLSLITHRHGDHWEPSLFAGTDWSVAGPDDVIASAPASRVVPLGEATTFGPMQIQRLRTPHAHVGHHSYVVTWHGRRLYFIGDTESTDTLLATRNLDVAFLSPWVYRSLVKRGLSPDARRIVIYHHQAGEQVPECRDRCSVPKQGDVIRID
jgi:L-ascorbate metabolism protein UlaG (beta-lactamase superfamily)